MPSGRFLTLRAKPFRDADLILDVISKEGERLVLTAKNALNSKRRFGGGVLEPLNFVEILYTQAKSKYLYVQEAKLVYSFSGLRSDYQRLELAFYFLKLVTKGTYEGLQDNKALFDLLGNSLKVLEETQSLNTLKLQFEFKYLYYLGVLALDEDTSEFIAKPVSQHSQIELTDEEYHYLSQMTKKGLQEVTQVLVEQHPQF